MKKDNPYKILLDTFGEEIQLQFAIEEMGELLQAICKYKRKHNSCDKEEFEKVKSNLQEEIADVMFCCEELAYMFGQSEIEKIKNMKRDRSLKRAAKKNTELTEKN